MRYTLYRISDSFNKGSRYEGGPEGKDPIHTRKKSIIDCSAWTGCQNGMTVVEIINPNVIENMAGLGFQPTAQWGMITTKNNSVVQDNLTDNYGF